MSMKRTSDFGGFLVSGGALTLIVLVVFIALRWLNVPAGNLIDWVVGVASFWWLLSVVVVGWNIYFGAKEVAAQAAQSIAAGIKVETSQTEYVRRIASRALCAAIALHVLSAAALLALAAAGISPVGYVASGAALLLTGLRPALSLYEYLYARLAQIRHDLLYPREDVVELRARVVALEDETLRLARDVDPADPESFLATQSRALETTRADVARLVATLENTRAANELEHERLARDAQRLVSQISVDGQVLDHVRELIRFFKTA
jgi:hypothetical protein